MPMTPATVGAETICGWRESRLSQSHRRRSLDCLRRSRRWISSRRAACDHAWQPRLRARRGPAREPVAIDHARLARPGTLGRRYASGASCALHRDLLAGFIDALKIDRVVLIGNSIGGSAAMAYAAQFPERVAGLILANPGGLIPMNALGRRFCGMMAALGRAGKRDAFYFKPVFSMLYRQVAANGGVAGATRSDCRCGRRMRRNLGAGVAELSHAAADQTGIGAQIVARFCSPGRRAIKSSRSRTARRRSAAFRIIRSRSSAAAIARSSKSPKSFSRRSEPFLENVTREQQAANRLASAAR